MQFELKIFFHRKKSGSAKILGSHLWVMISLYFCLSVFSKFSVINIYFFEKINFLAWNNFRFTEKLQRKWSSYVTFTQFLLMLIYIYILKFYLFIYLFIYCCVGSSFLCEGFLSSCGKWGPLFIAVRGPLTIAASLVAEHRLQMRRLSNCGSRAQLLRRMWDLPRPGIEPVSSALAGRFSTTAPPGKPLMLIYYKTVIHLLKLKC